MSKIKDLRSSDPFQLGLSSATLEVPESAGRKFPSVREFPVPYLMVLYAADLSRVGEVTEPALFIDASDWVTFGRREPVFVDCTRDGSERRELSDPFISRRQLALKWDRAQRAFRVRPLAGAQCKLVSVTLSPERKTPELQEIVEDVLLPPHSLLAVGNRALLLLCHAPWRAHVSDRMGLIGETAAMWRMRQEIASMARFKKPALVLGETGSGKELVARALCAQSPRAEGPFQALNCAALPEQLVESELFGHVKGAFTGAVSDKKGVFQATHGGTLFLDEFGELPMRSQAKLLRVFQEGLVTPVGSHDNIGVDVRLIAATNRAPEEEMATGRLRTDLYYRISSHVIQVPTLAQRRWDIPLLFVHFLRAISAEHPALGWLWESGRHPTPAVPLDFVLSLLSHRWPGNVRELQNVVDQTARLNLVQGPFQYPNGPWGPDSQTLSTPLPRQARPALVPPTQQGFRVNPALGRASRTLKVTSKTVLKLLTHDGQLDPALERLDFEVLVEELRERLAQNLFELMASHNHNQKRVAAQLEISRNTLARLIQTFRLPRPQDLDIETLRVAWRRAEGDVEKMAHQLQLSPRTLRLYLTRSDLLAQLQGDAQP